MNRSQETFFEIVLYFGVGQPTRLLGSDSMSSVMANLVMAKANFDLCA